MKIVLFITLYSLFMGCGSSTVSDKLEGITWYKPNSNTSWQWQLQGVVDTSRDVQIYDIDLFDTKPALIKSLKKSGKRVICYFSAGSFEDWREDSSNFPKEVLGNVLDGWEHERWLDIRDERVLSIMRSRLDLAVQKGCDGVEPDNVDGYINDTGFELSSKNQLLFNKALAKEAHKRGLSIGLKNDLDQILELEPYFDFSLNEQCFEFDECSKLTPFIDANKPVLNAEYSQKYNDKNKRDEICKESIKLGFKTLFLPLILDNSFRYSCD